MSNLDICQILKRLPHRYPFLLIDRVIQYEPNVRLLAMKNVTINEPFFAGHFPHRPIMPAVLILEAMAQATVLLESCSRDPTGKETAYHSQNMMFYFVGIDKVRIRRPVEPGDQLYIEVKQLRKKLNVLKFDGNVKVDGHNVANAQIMGALRPL